LSLYQFCLKFLLPTNPYYSKTQQATSQEDKEATNIPTLQLILMAASVAVSLAVLIYASWRDYVCREVSNRVWAIYGPIGLALTLSEVLLYEQTSLIWYVLSIGVTVGIALLLFYTGGFGGADSKALMCIAVTLPFAPIALFEPVIANAISPQSTYIYPITIFGNAVLFAAASGVYMVIRNIIWHKRHNVPMFAGSLSNESAGKKTLVLITGYRMPIAKLKEKWHIYPMEDVDDCHVENRKLVIVPREEGRDKIVERLSNAIDAKNIDSYVWATPGLPMLIFVTLGLIVALFGGDMVWLLVRTVLGS
jgi:archaeal preflagellin peptidase FlaK